MDVFPAGDGLPGLSEFEWGRAAVDTVAASMASDGAHDAGHLGRVFANARTITRGERDRGESVDWEVVTAAVLFHDLVNLPKDDPRRSEASAVSAERTVDFFRQRDALTEDRIELLAEAIERHSYSRGMTPESPEAKIVCDADRLDALGAVGLARCFYVSGTMEGQISDPADPFAESRERDDTAFAIDHFFEKLLHLKDDFLTPTARAMAEGRHAFVVGFLEQYAGEIGVELPSPVARHPSPGTEPG